MSHSERALVLGGGVSGYLCACFLKDMDAAMDVAVVERPGAALGRILVSGNGRCNIYNLDLAEDCLPDDPLFDRARTIVDGEYGSRALAQFERLYRVPLYSKGRLMYPFSNRSDTVMRAISETAYSLGVKRINGEVISVSKDKRVTISDAEGKKRTLQSDHLVLAMGGQCLNYPPFDWAILKDLGLSVIPYTAALGPIGVREDLSSLNGYRVRGTLSLLDGDREVYSEAGEVLFRPRAISGICAFDCSIRIDPSRVTDFRLKLDMSSHDGATIDPEREDLERSLPLPVADYVRTEARRLGVSPGSLVSKLIFRVSSLPDFRQSQVSRGGIEFSQIDPSSMRLRGHSGIYAIGEMVDIPLHCGGYNIGMCMVEGFKAALDIASASGE